MKVLLGMSGGIDSSVAAILLQEQGYQVVGVTLRLWSDVDGFDNEQIPEFIHKAQKLAEKLGIEHHVLDVKQEFYDLVIQYFQQGYFSGKTPNPCAKCNVVLKWHQLNVFAEKHDCSFIATGHYVNKVEQNGLYYITKGLDPEKEQSFFLWGLAQNILKKALFPLGKLSKLEVRAIANEHGFVKLNNQKESTGVCFLSDNNYHDFLIREFSHTNSLPGTGLFVDSEGTQLGEHKGFPFYTVGQRRGLGLVPKEPLYVTAIKPETNTVVLGSRNELYKPSMLVENYQVVNKSDFENEVITKIRYRKQSALSKVRFISATKLEVNFLEPEWSIAPGQAAAFYIGNKLLGGGFIVDNE